MTQNAVPAYRKFLAYHGFAGRTLDQEIFYPSGLSPLLGNEFLYCPEVRSRTLPEQLRDFLTRIAHFPIVEITGLQVIVVQNR